MCGEHNVELLYYCETCDKLVCRHCLVQDHPGHSQDTVKSIAYTYKRKFKEVTAPIEKMNKDLSETYNNVDKIKNMMQQKVMKLIKTLMNILMN